ncbi:Anti-sigma regulatory factor (Ser/Thr protein kinase) [Paucidesulfovibrio gracilis DSM 16080]|uniref:Anti-sigma regulatory factor (Ser/Thr protein kinase) n=1 Tax=Paucidesulfovibrio gracilis DSM 16080 TaxID=1121449 RepID=A0A1T4WYK5_9BACT|nr:ATP-binding protein [Paucidesulfovibrio gracilis]SKA81948.1 Anti-sigma regulatory factor (Ser/Thr protein kinase) [Paucidesulfovibrio gracilis DSM 16080]
MADALRLEAKLDNLEPLLDFAAGQFERLGAPGELGGRLRLVLEELLVNVCHYAYAVPQAPGAPHEGLVEVTCLREPGTDGKQRFCVCVRDWGVPFDPLQREAPDVALGVEERPVGGLGILLAVEMADHLQYARQQGANVLTACFDL